jgi:NhaP-type Na+/H+ or K+/H+ antiporter
VAIIAWAGLRGAVALATALALPERVGAHPFPDRNLILFLTFGVIFVTLAGQGLSLSRLIRWLGVAADDTAEREEQQARLTVAQAALQRLDLLAGAGNVPRDVLDDLRMHYQQRIAALEAHHKSDAGSQQHVATRKDIQREILSAERAALVALRDNEVIGDAALRRVQRDLELDEVRLR